MMSEQADRCRHVELAAHVGTVAVARDMEAIRVALGEEQISYAGFSYGGRLGWTYAQLFPDRVRAMVLDAPEDPTADVATTWLDQVAAIDAELTAYAAFCSQLPSTDCPNDPIATIVDLTHRADVAPISTDAPRPPLSGQLVAFATISALFADGSWSDYTHGLVEALAGDGTALYDFAARFAGRQGDGTYADPSDVATLVWCNDRADRLTTDDADELWRRSVEISAAVSQLYPTQPPRCWGQPDAVEPTPLPDDPAIPALLVVSSTGDPLTPLAGAEHLTALLGDAALLIRDGHGHTSYLSNQCVNHAVEHYLNDLVLPEPGTVC